MFSLSANWKMNKTLEESVIFCQEILEQPLSENISITLFPNLVSLAFLSEFCAGTPINLGVQNISDKRSGAYTGETSLIQIQDYADIVMVGHSERRKYAHEDDRLAYYKLDRIFQDSDLDALLCIGEDARSYADGTTNLSLKQTLYTTLQDIPKEHVHRLKIAYEPVWAISDGQTAQSTPTNTEIEQALLCIKNTLSDIFGKPGRDIPLLYGGSVTHNNAAEIADCDGVNGFLIGGASLDAEHFLKISKIVG